MMLIIIIILLYYNTDNILFELIMIIHIICITLLFYYLTTILYLNNFIFCNRKYRNKNEKKPFKTCFKQELIKKAFFNNTNTEYDIPL